MRRFPLIAASALLAAGVVTGSADSASAGKPPSFTSKTVTIDPDASGARCVLSLNWTVSGSTPVAGYLVQGDNAPLKGKNDVPGEVITNNTTWWVIDDDQAFYMQVTILLADGKESKSWNVGSDRWSCL